jgi:hypothetical protein
MARPVGVLQLHPQKTKVVYCNDANGPRKYPEHCFDFLGYTFRPRSAQNRDGKRFVSFLPAVSDKAARRMRHSVRRWRLHRRNDLELEEIAAWVRLVLSGWVRYYGRFYPSKLRTELRTIDAFIVRWAIRKYKRFRGHTKAVWDWLRALKRRNSNCSLIGPVSSLRPDDGSWMTREVHVQFWKGVGLRCPALLAYLKACQNVEEARRSIAAYLEFYNRVSYYPIWLCH